VIIHCPFRTISPFKSWDKILFWGGGSETPCVLRDTKSCWNSKPGFKFDVLKFCMVWTIKLSLHFS
jgi:hypothetical protein